MKLNLGRVPPLQKSAGDCSLDIAKFLLSISVKLGGSVYLERATELNFDRVLLVCSHPCNPCQQIC